MSNLVKKSDCGAKVSGIESKIPSISGLVTTSALTTVKNKIPSVSSLVRKTDYDTKISELGKNLQKITVINMLLLHNLII